MQSIGYIWIYHTLQYESFVCKPSTILVVKLPHGVLSRNIQQILHHRECITMSTCLGLPFSTSPQRQQHTQLSMEMDDMASIATSVQTSFYAASSCFFATTKRSKIMFICRPSTILVVKLPHGVLRANIQKTCHHRECIKKSSDCDCHKCGKKPPWLWVIMLVQASM